MTDQCKYCTYRGDLVQCQAAECSKHESWYAKQLQAENAELRAELERLKSSLELATNDLKGKTGLAYLKYETVSVGSLKADAIRAAVGESMKIKDSRTSEFLVSLHHLLEIADKLERGE